MQSSHSTRLDSWRRLFRLSFRLYRSLRRATRHQRRSLRLTPSASRPPRTSSTRSSRTLTQLAPASRRPRPRPLQALPRRRPEALDDADSARPPGPPRRATSSAPSTSALPELLPRRPALRGGHRCHLAGLLGPAGACAAPGPGGRLRGRSARRARSFAPSCAASRGLDVASS